MNLANKITISRIMLVPFFVIILFLPIPYSNLIAFIVFVIAASTDGIDGHIARSKNQITDFGKFLDPLADKLLVSAALIALVGQNKIPSWVATIIISREFIVTGIRLIAAGEGKVIAASMWGKIKTVTQIIAISLLLLDKYTLPINQSDIFMIGKLDNAFWNFIQRPSLQSSIETLSTVMLAIAVFTTIYSCYDYIVKNINVLKIDKC
jgi:CDP-diacylglycerol--glycerol-3-phosphate 3-phosphatidyltransferase